MMFGVVLHWIQSYCYLNVALRHFGLMISNGAKIRSSMCGCKQAFTKKDKPTLRHCFRLRWASVESRIVLESNSSSDAIVDSIRSSKLADRVVCDRETDGWFVITVVLDDSELESNDFNLWILSRLFWLLQNYYFGGQDSSPDLYLGTKFPY